jgi:hypothetical protein
MLNQQLANNNQFSPAELCGWMGAIQSQDFGAAKWAIGLRNPALKDTDVEEAYNRGEILRTHLMRPTWHFVSPENIRWLVQLTAPRVDALCKYNYKRLELDDAIFKRSNQIITNALAENNFLTRNEIGEVLGKNGIIATDLRLIHLMIKAELDGLVCSGPMKGKQFTYALMEERVKNQPTPDRDECLSRLAQLYFTSHGPATVPDFAWWCGLAAKDVARAMELAKHHLNKETIEGKVYWYKNFVSTLQNDEPTCFLVPNFDEYLISYKDRDLMLEGLTGDLKSPRGNIIFSNAVIMDGRIAGIWKRELKKDRVLMEINCFRRLDAGEIEATQKAARRYGSFWGLEAVVEINMD